MQIHWLGTILLSKNKKVGRLFTGVGRLFTGVGRLFGGGASFLRLSHCESA